MEDVCRVDVLETAQDLVDEGLEVCIGQGLAGSDDGCQIAFHEFCTVVSMVLLGTVGTEAYPRRGNIR